VLVRIWLLSFDVTEICTAFGNGQYGSGDKARAGDLSLLEDWNSGFTDAKYRTAFLAGQKWAGL
jgi:hypothetical protein